MIWGNIPASRAYEPADLMNSKKYKNETSWGSNVRHTLTNQSMIALASFSGTFSLVHSATDILSHSAALSALKKALTYTNTLDNNSSTHLVRVGRVDSICKCIDGVDGLEHAIQ